MKFSKNKVLALAALLFGTVATAFPQTDDNAETLRRVMSYKQSIGESTDTISTNVYVRYYFNTQKRNFALNVIPTMNAISRGGREFAGETFSDILVSDGTMVGTARLLDISTVPHYQTAMPVMLKYLMPNIYDKSLIDKQLLSPFNKHNKKLYKYHVSKLIGNDVKIAFRPKHHNTQLVNGSAIADKETGQIHSVRLSGEYDMVKFRISAVMGDSGQYALLPKTCDIESKFRFLGNRITSSYHSVYDSPATLPDSIGDTHDASLMDEVRPTPLPENIQELYAKHDSTIHVIDTVFSAASKKSREKSMRDVFGQYFINRIHGNFGTERQGSFRLSPIINPLYLSYSKRKGISYKMTFAGSYSFTSDMEFSLNFKAGYSFKQRQFYFKAPLRFYYNKGRNGHVTVEVGNGNRIKYSNIINAAVNESADSTLMERVNMKYFTDLYLNVVCNYDVTRRFSVQPGLIFHRRSAVDKEGFVLAELRTKYYSFAPKLEVRYIPVGSKGPVLTADYERGVRLRRSDMVYERYEFDASWKKTFNMLRTLSLRVGGGFYTSRDKDAYFLDYSNFKDENIPVGWNDNWSGDFQLLRSDWYNSSKYYVRTNATYESPMMMLARIPFIGNLMEVERIYVNTLFVEHLHPYVEYGYGFTNRFVSAGAFVATSNHKYSGIGFRIAFELFSDW